MASDKKPDGPNVVPLEVAAALIKVTTRRVQQLVKEGWIKKSGRGGYPLLSVVHGYIDFLQDEARRSSKSASASRVTDARTREIEIRIADKEKRHLVEAREEAIAAVDAIIGGLRADLIAAPARITADLEQRRKIETVLNDALRAAAERSDKLARGISPDGDAADASPEVNT